MVRTLLASRRRLFTGQGLEGGGLEGATTDAMEAQVEADTGAMEVEADTAVMEEEAPPARNLPSVRACCRSDLVPFFFAWPPSPCITYLLSYLALARALPNCHCRSTVKFARLDGEARGPPEWRRLDPGLDDRLWTGQMLLARAIVARRARAASAGVGQHFSSGQPSQRTHWMPLGMRRWLDGAFFLRGR
jgi:hypothetical protein